VAVRRALRDLRLVVVVEAAHDARRLVLGEAERAQDASRGLERRAEHLAHRRHAELGVFVGIGAAARAGDDLELREALPHALHGGEGGLGIVDGDEQHPGRCGAGGFEQVHARRVAVVGFPAEAPHGIDLAGIVVDHRRAYSQASQDANDDLPEAAEAGDDHRLRFADRVRGALGAPVAAARSGRGTRKPWSRRPSMPM